MGKNKSKKSKKSYKYGSDIIAYYGRKKDDKYTPGFMLEQCDADDVHKIAEKVFGTSYYIDFENMQ